MGDIEIIPFQIDMAKQAAIVRSNLEQAGQPIGSYDILIAATTLTLDLILVTSNEKEFSRIPNLKMENWRLPTEAD